MTSKQLDNRLPHRIAVICLTFVLIALASAIDYPDSVNGNFFSDCATYYSLASSLAHDQDLEFAREDLQRVYADFSGGPGGIFLQRNDTTERLFHGKSYIYPVFLSAFLLLFATDGILIFHSLLFGLVSAGMVAVFRLHWGTTKAFLFSLCYLLPTGALVFFFWVSPEFFNMAIIFAGFFFLIYKEINPAVGEVKKGTFRSLLYSDASDIVAVVFLGMAAFSKLSNGVFFAAFLLIVLFRKRWKSLFAGIAIFFIVVVLLFGLQLAGTGHWNYQGGDRSSFHNEFPYANGKDYYSAGGTSMRTNVGEWSFPFFPVDIANNITYFFVGRFGGIVPYYFPAALLLLFFLLRGWGRVSWIITVLALVTGITLHVIAPVWNGAANASAFVFPLALIALLIVAMFSNPLHRNVVVLTAAAAALTYIILVPTNVIGGGGTVTNRYFMNIFPLFFFLAPRKLPRFTPFLAAFGGVLFMGHILINPFFHSRFTSHYGGTDLLRTFPIEKTMLNDLPINTDSTMRRMPWYQVENGEVARYTSGKHEGKMIEGFQVYRMDYNSYAKEPNPASVFENEAGELTRQYLSDKDTQQIWTVGGKTTQLVLRSVSKRDKLRVRISNANVENHVSIELDGKSLSFDMKPREKKTFEFELGEGYAYHYLSTSYLYVITISTSSGVTPRTLEGGANDYRHLGVMLEFWMSPEIS